MKWPWSRPESTLLEAVSHCINHAAGEAGELRPESLLGADLGLSSLAVARLAGLLQKRFGGPPLPFHTLFIQRDGTLKRDLRVADLVEFLERHGRTP